MTTHPDSRLEQVLREVEEHVHGSGWDQPARLYALVPTADLLAREPGLADVLGLGDDVPEGHLTPVEQELPPEHAEQLEQVLELVEWPEGVAGCAVVLERLVLPPGADRELPADDGEAAAYARAHPDRQEVRIAAGVLREKSSYALLRMRAHDQEAVGGKDLVPGLVRLLAQTLEEI